LNKAHEVIDKYYQMTNMSPIYAAALILNPKRCTRYIQTHWKREWSEPALRAIQALWETYREALIALLITTPFSYEKHNQTTLRELNRFMSIALTLEEQSRPCS